MYFLGVLSLMSARWIWRVYVLMARNSPLKPQHNKAFLQEIFQFILTTVELLRTIIYGSYDDCVNVLIIKKS